MNKVEQSNALSPQDLMSLGMEQVAYVKPIEIEGVGAFAVHAADGTQIAIMKSRDSAVAAILHNDLEAISLH